MRSSLSILVLSSCVGIVSAQDGAIVARLGAPAARAAFDSIRDAFRAHNPGYDVDWCEALDERAAGDSARVVLVQRAGDGARLTIGETASGVAVGDVALVRRGQTLGVTGDVAALVVSVPGDPDASLPAFFRPDHDPKLTDTPGGCAEESGAYRRILLTWQPDVGPYVWHAINVHRVRVDDSLTHYHPVEGGFDELYLVQGAEPGARILTSARTARILDPDSVTREQAKALLRSTDLYAGDLVYLPRGVVHRGLGGVLAQVITVPGFRPGAEIGVDRELAAIDRRLGLAGDDALPFHRKAGPDIDASGVAIERSDDGARITIDGEPFTELWTTAYHVPILHPVLGPGGVRVTRGYPMIEAPNETHDHPHHRGLWFTHGDVNGVDFWSDRGPKRGRIDVTALRVPAPNMLELDTAWRDASDRTLLTGHRVLRFGRIGDARAIDFTVTLVASEGDVRFGDTKEGTMAIRLAPELRLEGTVATGHIVDSEGDLDGDVWGRRARWVDYSGRIGDAEIGVALLDHPSNPRSPCYWHARGYGLFAANPFGAHDFAKRPKGAGDLVIPADASATFRYRFLIHSGDAELAGIASEWRRFAAP